MLRAVMNFEFSCATTVVTPITAITYTSLLISGADRGSSRRCYRRNAQTCNTSVHAGLGSADDGVTRGRKRRRRKKNRFIGTCPDNVFTLRAFRMAQRVRKLPDPYNRVRPRNDIVRVLHTTLDGGIGETFLETHRNNYHPPSRPSTQASCTHAHNVF